MAKQITRQADGRFVRNLGYVPSGSQPKFYLGKDENDAIVRNALLVKVWDAVKRMHRDHCGDDSRPAWSDDTLAIARGVADGLNVIRIGGDDDDVTAAAQVAELQQLMPFIRIELRSAGKQHSGQQYWREEGQQRIASGKAMAVQLGNQRLHEALADYIAHIKTAYQTPAGVLSDWGSGKVNQVKFLLRVLPDERLADMDMAKIDALLGIIARRPISAKSGNPISRVFARATIKEFRVFLRWLNRSSVWHWRRPDDYEVLPVRVAKTVEEKASRGPINVETYDAVELRTLWSYATPWERVLMVLGLNCGFGMAEIGTLRCDEVLLRQPHPFAAQLGILSDASDSWIRRIRSKTEVYGEWRLWPITVAAVEWLLSHRAKVESPYLVLTKVGSTLKTEGQRNNGIANAWQRLSKRVQKDHESFPERSFGKLRKTAINLVRLDHGEEIAGLFASHGEGIIDNQIGHYANPRYVALHRAITDLGRRLETVFSAESEPFPEGETLGGANVSLAIVQRILDLHEKGYRPGIIASKLNISRETVRRWLKRNDTKGKKKPAAK